MLTGDDVKKVQALKARGYSKERAAKTLGFARGTVAKFWGGNPGAGALADLERRFADLERRLHACFGLITCGACELIYGAPRVLPAWRCPRCDAGARWQGLHFTERAEEE